MPRPSPSQVRNRGPHDLVQQRRGARLICGPSDLSGFPELAISCQHTSLFLFAEPNEFRIPIPESGNCRISGSSNYPRMLAFHSFDSPLPYDFISSSCVVFRGHGHRLRGRPRSFRRRGRRLRGRPRSLREHAAGLRGQPVSRGRSRSRGRRSRSRIGLAGGLGVQRHRSRLHRDKIGVQRRGACVQRLLSRHDGDVRVDGDALSADSPRGRIWMFARIPRMSDGLSAPAVTRARRRGGPRTDRNADRDGPRRTGVGTGWGRTATRSGTDRGRTGLGTGDGLGDGVGTEWGPSPPGPTLTERDHAR